MPIQVPDPRGFSRSGVGFQTDTGNSPDAFGAVEGRDLVDIGQGLGQAGAVTIDLAEQIQKQENEREAKQLDMEYASALTNAGFGDGTAANPGFYSRNGQDALDNADAVSAFVQEARNQIGSKASNPAVAAMFDSASATRLSTEFKGISRHVAAQRVIANQAVSEARMSEAHDSAIRFYNDDEHLDQSLEIVAGEAVQQTRAAGGDEEVALSAVQNARTAVISGVIDGAIKAGDLNRANQIFEERKELIDGRVIPDIQEKLQNANNVAFAQEQAGAAGRLFPGSLAEQLDWARKVVPEGERQAAVVAEIKRRHSEQTTITETNLRQVAGDAAEAILSGQQSLDDLAIEAPDMYRTILRDPETFNRLRKAEIAQAEGRIYARVTDGNTAHQLLQLPDAKLATLNLAEYKAVLTKKEYEEVFSAQRVVKKSLAEELTDGGAVNSGIRLLQDIAPSHMGINTQDISPVGHEVQRRMMSFISDHVEAHGRPPSVADQLRQARLLVTEVDIPGATILGLTEEDAFIDQIREATPEERLQIIVQPDEIAPETRNEIETEMRRVNELRRAEGLVEVELTDSLLSEIAGSMVVDAIFPNDQENHKRLRTLFGFAE